MKKENNNIDGFCRFIVEFNVKSMKDGTLSVFERKKNQKQHEFLVISIELLVIPIELLLISLNSLVLSIGREQKGHSFVQRTTKQKRKNKRTQITPTAIFACVATARARCCYKKTMNYSCNVKVLHVDQ